MSEYLRSALNNLSSNWNANAGDKTARVETDNEFVGQSFNLKGYKLRVERVIAEGIITLT